MPDRDEQLTRLFGLPSFHPWQRQAVDAILDGPGRALVIAPTGGGKSLCYQFPAAVLEGTAVVVSPLIALMDDQVRSLERRGIPATFLASTLDFDERRRREDALADGQYRIVYVAPERLRNDFFVQRLMRLSPTLVAIDEAHCIAQWGHDFRPDYLRLKPVIDQLAPPRLLACTATATPAVRDEIAGHLGLETDAAVHIMRGFARPNLHLTVEAIERPAARRARALRIVEEALGGPSSPSGSAIVYAGTRRHTEQLAARFEEAGWRTGCYHAGVDPEGRDRVSEAFAAQELDVVVATNAFGMGIDRPDIRCVVHTQAPGSVEQYYQEVGRAGRDGQPAHGRLLSGTSDFGARRRLIDMGSGPDGSAGDEALRARQWQLFLELMRYVEAGSCRHDYILRYFGDEQETLGGCGHCDVCLRLEAGEGEPGEVSEEDALVVVKALAGVARLRQRSGLQALAANLHGEDSDKIRQLGLDLLSTHGILSDRPKPWIIALLRRLLAAGLIDLVGAQYPVVGLTALGIATMKRDEPVRVLLPHPDAGKTRKAKTRRKRSSAPREDLPDLDPDDAQLFERLREARRDHAKTLGVPAYVVCHDRTLHEIALRKPASEGELLDIHGMGPARVDAHGAALLAVIRGG